MRFSIGRLAKPALLSAGLALGITGAVSAQDYPHDTVTLVTHSSAEAAPTSSSAGWPDT